jgi:hypothetical protein
MDIGFTGSRDYPRPDLVANFVRVIARKYPDATIVSGGRGNVDETAEKTGEDCGLAVISYIPHENHIEVRKLDPANGAWLNSTVLGHNNFVRNCFLRNNSIAFCDRVIAFWDLKSRGTADTISKARGKQRELFVYGPDGAQLTSQQVANQLKEVLG